MEQKTFYCHHIEFHHSFSVSYVCIGEGVLGAVSVSRVQAHILHINLQLIEFLVYLLVLYECIVKQAPVAGLLGRGGGPPHKKEGVGASLAKGEGSSFGPTLKAYLMSQRRIRDPPPPPDQLPIF